MTAGFYTVVRIKSAVSDPKPGCLVWVLAADAEDRHVEYQTTEPVAVGDRITVNVTPARPAVAS